MSDSKSFTAQVDEIILRNSKKVDALIRASINDVIDDAQLSKAKGGRMPVDTGFLRASGQLSLTGMPSGPTRDMSDKTYTEPTFTATLAGATAGDTLFFGWTAVYAGKQEYVNGYLSGALQKWQSIVAKNVEKLR